MGNGKRSQEGTLYKLPANITVLSPAFSRIVDDQEEIKKQESVAMFPVLVRGPTERGPASEATSKEAQGSRDIDTAPISRFRTVPPQAPLNTELTASTHDPTVTIHNVLVELIQMKYK